MKIYESPAGATLIGAISALALVLFVVKHRGFREWTVIGLLFCMGSLGTLAWLLPPQTWHHATPASFFENIPTVLFFAGVGVSLCSISAQALWGVAYASIRRSSWQRRQWTPPLPPLESVSKAYRCTVNLSSSIWSATLLTWLALGCPEVSISSHLLVACGASSVAMLTIIMIRHLQNPASRLPPALSTAYNFTTCFTLVLSLLS